jgi:MraZ protein
MPICPQLALMAASVTGRAASMFLGTHIVGVDAKGRASVPAPFRALLKGGEDGRGRVYVWPSFRGAYLEGGDLALLTRYQAALASRGEFDDLREDLDYAIFAEARALDLDDTGRASLPEDLRAHAQLDGKAAFVGLSERFEIWSPPLLDARISEARTRAAEKRALLARGSAP